MPQDFGLQLGTMLGKAMAQPLDFTRLTNYLLQQREHQKQMKIKIMRDLGDELASYNPNGIQQKDIKDFHRLYNNWKTLAVNNVDVLENPQRDLDTYLKIMSAKKNLDVGLAKMKEANTMKGMIAKIITEQGLKDKKLAPDAMQYWTHIKQTPTLELQRPIDLGDLIVFNPSAKDIMEEANKAMDKGIQYVDATFPSVEDNGKTLTQYSIPSYESIATSTNMYFASDKDLQNLYSAKFKDLSDADKEDIQKRIANLYKKIPPEFLGGKTNKDELKDFNIDTPEKLFEAYYILSKPPQLTKTAIPNQTYFKVKNNKEQEEREKTQNQHHATSVKVRKQGEVARMAKQIYDDKVKHLQEALDKEYDRKLYDYKQAIKYGESATPPKIEYIPQSTLDKFMKEAEKEAKQYYNVSEPVEYKYQSVGADGETYYSPDQKTWYDANGNKVNVEFSSKPKFFSDKWDKYEIK